MQADRHIAIWGGWIAAPAFGVAMMAAPEYLKLEPPASALLFWGGLAIFFLTIVVVSILALHDAERKTKVVGPIITMAIGTLILGCGLGWYFWTSKQTTIVAEHLLEPKFSWIWEPLTEKQIEAIANQLKDKGAGSVTMTFNARNAGKIAASFKSVFERAKWGIQPMPQLNSIYGGVSGLAHYPNNDIGRTLKDAVETHTDLKLNFVVLRHASASETSMFIIGARPLPEPIPTDIKKDLSELGQKLKDMATAIGAFAIDRKREQSLLPPRESFDPTVQGARKWFDRNVAFSKETEALLAQKFQQAAFLLGELEMLGIEMPFFIQNSQTDPARVAKWYNFVGSYLEQGRIEEGRIKAADNDFWFRQ